MDKFALRAKFRALRRGVSAAERERRSLAICDKLLKVVESARASSKQNVAWVAVYLASPDEIDLSSFIMRARALGLKIAVPRWNGTDYALAELKEPMRMGPHNIPEPETAAVEPIVPAVWIVPGLAFTSSGGRLGYGGGWYDRLLRGASAAVKLGVGYAFQIVDSLPLEEHDVKLDAILV